MALDKFIAQRNALNELGTLNQKSIDFIIDSARKKSEDMHPKGIQEKTLHLILKYMKENGHMWMSGENIAEEVGLTGVTVRRYLNYLTEVGSVVGEINYETGGRPCMLYKVVE